MILAVDDEHVLLVLIEAVCEAEGFEVETFLDPEEALLRAAEVRPDLVISDVMMPGLDGFAFKEALEDLYPDRNIPFIFLSSRSSTDDLVRGLDAGAEDYLTKPIDQKLLGAKIRSLLRRTREEQTAVFHGQLSEFPLQRILGFCETQGLTGSVEFELEGVPIFLFLRQGVIDLGPLKGREEILLKISELREGKFTIRAQGGEFLLGGNPWPTSADDSYTSYRENGLTDPDTREGKLRYLLRHDRLTGLPNRLHLKEGLGKALREAREQKRHVAVLIIDLDHFRTINDGLGHAVGDLLLQRVTDRLRGWEVMTSSSSFRASRTTSRHWTGPTASVNSSPGHSRCTRGTSSRAPVSGFPFFPNTVQKPVHYSVGPTLPCTAPRMTEETAVGFFPMS